MLPLYHTSLKLEIATMSSMYERIEVQRNLWFVLFVTLNTLFGSNGVFAYPFATYVMDAQSGKTLFSQNSDTKLHPASLTKMMTLYLAFSEVESGRLDLDERVVISRNAAREPPSKFGYRVGQKVSIRYLIRAAAIRSANDAATALGEAISGSEKAFGNYMTITAKAMGMSRTSFRNANGLTSTNHLSTARDMALLGRRLLYDFPEYYHLFGRRSVVSLGRTLYNTNRKFLAMYNGADGIKTGFTSAAGYNLTASAKRGKKRVIAVIFGSGSVKLRSKRMTELLNIGFARAANFNGRVVLKPLKPQLFNPLLNKSSGVIYLSSQPLLMPKKLLVRFSSATKTINIAIENLLNSKDFKNIKIESGASAPLLRPVVPNLLNESPALISNEESLESKVMKALENEDLNTKYSILVGSYYTEFNAKKDFTRLALSDFETLGTATRSIEAGVVNKKLVFQVSFSKLKKLDAMKACEKLIARNEICEISEFSQ